MVHKNGEKAMLIGGDGIGVQKGGGGSRNINGRRPFCSVQGR